MKAICMKCLEVGEVYPLSRGGKWVRLLCKSCLREEAGFGEGC